MGKTFNNDILWLQKTFSILFEQLFSENFPDILWMYLS